MKFFVKDFATNKYVHNINIPKSLENLRTNLLYSKHVDRIWDINKTNVIYKILIDDRKCKPSIEYKYENSNWELIWKVLNQVNNLKNKTIIYKFLHNILPIGKYLVKLGIINKIPKCMFCQKALYTYEHIFEYCENFKNVREKLFYDLKIIKNNIIINSNLIQTGSNNFENTITEQYVCKAIFNFILDIWDKIMKYLRKRE